MKEKTFFKGREYQDVIHHNTTSQFLFADRIRILFGAKVYINSKLFCNNEYVHVVGSEADTFVARLFPKKRNGGEEIIMSSPSTFEGESR
jgi:hypothetical protein